MKLYELTGAFNEIFDLLENNDEELNYQTLEDTLQSLEGAIEVKAGGIAKMIKSLEKTAEAYGSEAKRLSEKEKSTKNKVKWLKSYLLQAMEATAKDKIQTDIGTISRQKSPISVYLVDELEIPNEYWYTPSPLIDKRAILEALKQGKQVPGAELRQGYHIRIR